MGPWGLRSAAVSASLQSEVEPLAQSLVHPWTSPLGEGGKSQSPPGAGPGGLCWFRGPELDGGRGWGCGAGGGCGKDHQRRRGGEHAPVSEGSCWQWTWNRDNEGGVHTGQGGGGAGGPGLQCLSFGWCCPSRDKGTTVLSPLSQPHGGGGEPTQPLSPQGITCSQV